MKNRMVKIIAVTIPLLMLLSVPSFGNQAPIVNMEVSKNILYPNEQFWANISIEGNVTSGSNINIFYDPSILKVIQLPTNAYHTDGKISVLLASPGNMSIVFQAIGIGNTTIHMHANISSYIFDENQSISVIPFPNHIMFEPSAIEANINTYFEVNVSINATQEWNLTSFNITYDPEILTLENYSLGDTLNNSSTINEVDGTIICNLIANEKTSGKTNLITLKFYGKKAGISNLVIYNASLFNGTNPLKFDIINGKVEVIAVSLYFTPDYSIVYMATGRPSQFSISLFINSLIPIQSIYLSISFNSSLLNATIENGNAFNTFIPVINNSTGIIQITALNFTKNGILANITFSTLQGGIANIYVSSVTAIDKNFTTVYTHNENATVEILIDDIPPTTTLQHGTPYYNDYITSSTLLYINASDDGGNASGVKEIHYIIDGVEHIAYGNVVINITGNDGWHNIEYYSIDNLGNEEQHHVATYYLDNTPPETSIQFGLPYYYDGNHWVRSDTPLSFNATDVSGIAITYYRIYNGTAWSNWSQCTTSFSLSADGMNYIEFYSIDNVGNEEQHHNVTVYVDNNPPVVHYSVEPSSPDGENGWYISNVNFNLTAYDNESGLAEIMYKINNGIWQLYNGTIEFTNDGEYAIQFYAKDNVENNNSNSILIKIDRVPPTSRCDFSGKYSNGKYTTDVTVTITASDVHAGVKEIYYSVDGGAWHKVSGAKATTVVTSEGAHTVEYYAVDKAGNEEQHHVAAFTIEKNKPPIASFEYTPLQPYDTDKIKFDASSSYDSDGSIVNYTWQFGDGSVGYGKIVYHKYGENKEYNVTLVVKDDKGASDKITKKIVVANKPPIADFTHTPKKPNVGEKVKFDASISMDDDGNIVNYTWHFEDGTIEYGKIVNYTYEKEGNYSVTLVVTDDDGATATITGYIIVRKEISNIWLPLTIILILAIIAIALVTIWKKRTKS